MDRRLGAARSEDPDAASAAPCHPHALARSRTPARASSAIRRASESFSLHEDDALRAPRVCAGGTGERVVHEPRVPRGPARSERSELQGGEGALRERPA